MARKRVVMTEDDVMREYALPIPAKQIKLVGKIALAKNPLFPRVDVKFPDGIPASDAIVHVISARGIDLHPRIEIRLLPEIRAEYSLYGLLGSMMRGENSLIKKAAAVAVGRIIQITLEPWMAGKVGLNVAVGEWEAQAMCDPGDFAGFLEQ